MEKIADLLEEAGELRNAKEKVDYKMDIDILNLIISLLEVMDNNQDRISKLERDSEPF